MRLPAAVQLLRPHQWWKNLIVFVPLVFSQNVFSTHLWPRSIVVAAAFCALSSAAYVVNDLVDLRRDRLHPVKRHRPLASGRLRVGAAVSVGILAAAAGLALLLLSNPATLALGGAFILIQLAYTLVFRAIVLWDAILIGIGFVVRALAGTVTLEVGPPTSWLILCTFLLALFLALAKRRHELRLLGQTATAPADHRASLRDYSRPLLDQTLILVSTLLLTAYCLYTFFGNTSWMMLTIPFALYGVLRYNHLSGLEDGRSETQLLFGDPAMILNAAAWLATAVAVLYGLPQTVMAWFGSA